MRAKDDEYTALNDLQWVRLEPARRMANRLYGSIIVGLALTWFAVMVGLSLASHRTAGKVAAFAAVLVAALAAWAFALYGWRVYRNLEDAKVFIDKVLLVLGEGFRVRVEQRARRGIYISEMRLALVCQETVRHRTPDGKEGMKARPLLEKWETLTRDKRVDHARRLSATREMAIPPEQPASSPPGQKQAPLVRWKLRVVTAAADSPRYDVDFPLFVVATAPQAQYKESSKDKNRDRVHRRYDL